MATKATSELTIRWLVHNDMDDVLMGDRRSHAEFWTYQAWKDNLARRNCIGMVAVLREGNLQHIVGAMLYDLHKSHLELLRLFVAPDYRRRGFGSAMVGKLRSKLQRGKREAIAVNVSEYDVSAQVWLSRRGFWGHPHGDQIRFESVHEWSTDGTPTLS